MGSPAPCVASADLADGIRAIRLVRGYAARTLVRDRGVRGHSKRTRKPTPIPTSSITTAQPITRAHTGLW